VDATLPFRLQSDPKIFNALADAAQSRVHRAFDDSIHPWHNGLFKKWEHGICGITWMILSLLELHVGESAGLIVKLCVVHVKFLESHWHLRNVKDQYAVWFFWASSSTP